MQELVAKAAGYDIGTVSAGKPFAAFGLGSVQVVDMSGQLCDWLGCAVPASIAWDYPDIRSGAVAGVPWATGGMAAGDEVFAEVTLPDDTDVAGCGLHPALLDAALHATGLTGIPVGMAPFSWAGVSLHACASASLALRPPSVPQPTGLLRLERPPRMLARQRALLTVQPGVQSAVITHLCSLGLAIPQSHLIAVTSLAGRPGRGRGGSSGRYTERSRPRPGSVRRA